MAVERIIPSGQIIRIGICEVFGENVTGNKARKAIRTSKVLNQLLQDTTVLEVARTGKEHKLQIVTGELSKALKNAQESYDIAALNFNKPWRDDVSYWQSQQIYKKAQRVLNELRHDISIQKSCDRINLAILKNPEGKNVAQVWMA